MVFAPAMRCLLFLLAAPAAFAQAAPFALLDANRDGKLSRQELPEPLRPHFALADANGDGSVSQDELTRALSGQPSAAPALPTNVRHLKDLDYAGKNNPRQKLDLLLPKDRTKKPPLVVFIHGGGWVSGRKEDGLAIARDLVTAGGYAAASLNYRLVTEAIWPAQIHDCKAAVRFLRAKAADYGFDGDRIGVMGMSAGGHLVSLLGTVNGEPALEGQLGPFAKTNSRVQCVVNFFGPTDFDGYLAMAPTSERRRGEQLVARLLGRDQAEVRRNLTAASPARWVTEDDAPFFTAHGTKDDLVPFAQATTIHTALEKAGVESHLVAMEGAGHGFASDELNRRILRFLDKHLRDRPAAISSEPIRVR
jgi:acetyl esterase/lipase